MMSFAPSARLALVAGGLALLAGIAARPVAAQTPPAPSPEEIAVALLPYQLAAADIPTGYESAGLSGDSPALEAWNASNSASEGQSALGDVTKSGFLSGFNQSLLPKPATPDRQFLYGVALYDSADDASAALHDMLNVPSVGPIQADNPPLTVTLGEESGAVHVVVTASSGAAQGAEAISWRRGRVLFSMIMVVPDLTETIDQVVPFAQAADAHDASVTPPAPVGTATLPVTSSEAVRVNAIYALYDRLPDSSLSPYGLRPTARSIVTNSDLILDKTDPKAAFTTLIGNTARIVGVERDYITLQRQGNDSLAVQYVLSASKQGAQAELQQPFDGSTQIKLTGTYSLPKPLGDASVLYTGTIAYPEGGSATVTAVLWTRGFVTLKVLSFSPANDIAATQLNDFAAQVDAFYGRGALPSVLTNPGGGTSAPGSSPTAPSNPVQSWSPFSTLVALLASKP